MKQQWRTRRQVLPQPDGQRRWDRAYQLLLEWTTPTVRPPDRDGGSVSASPRSSPASTQEVEHDGWRSTCACRPSGRRRRRPSSSSSSGCAPHLAAHAGRGGWQVGRHVFRDDGYSGATLNRPGPGSAARRRRARARWTACWSPPRPPGAQLRPADGAPGGAGARRLPGRVPGPADEPGPARPAPAADPRRRRRVRAHPHRRAHAARAADEVARRLLLPWTRPPTAIGWTPTGPAIRPASLEPAEAAVVRELFAGYLETTAACSGLAKDLRPRALPTPHAAQPCWSPSHAARHADQSRPTPARSTPAAGAPGHAHAPLGVTHPIGKPHRESVHAGASGGVAAGGDHSRRWSARSSSSRCRPSWRRTAPSPGATTRRTPTCCAPWSAAACVG